MTDDDKSLPKIIKMIDLPCGCQDIYYEDGRIEYEHDYVDCDGTPMELEPLTRPFSIVIDDA